MLSGEGEPCGQRPGELYLGAWLIGDANCNSCTAQRFHSTRAGRELGAPRLRV